MKMLSDRKSQNRVFKPGDKVLVLLPLLGNTLQARYPGPYQVLKRVGDLDYVIETPDRRKSTHDLDVECKIKLSNSEIFLMI